MPPARHTPPRQPRGLRRLRATTASSSTTTWTVCPRWSATFSGAIWRQPHGRHPEGWTLSVNDTSTESHTAEERAALQAADIGAYICPLLIKDGRFVGAFGFTAARHACGRPTRLPSSRKSPIGSGRRSSTARRKPAARERGAAGVSSPAERRGPPVERCGGHPGNCCKASVRASRRSPRRLCGTRGPRVHHSPRARPRRRAARRNALRIAVRARWARLRRGETIVVGDVQADQRLSDDDRAAFRSRSRR